MLTRPGPCLCGDYLWPGVRGTFSGILAYHPSRPILTADIPASLDILTTFGPRGLSDQLNETGWEQ